MSEHKDHQEQVRAALYDGGLDLLAALRQHRNEQALIRAHNSSGEMEAIRAPLAAVNDALVILFTPASSPDPRASSACSV